MYQASTAAEGKSIAEHVIGSFHDCPIPEVARPGRTLRMCRQHVLAQFETHCISNGGTEAVNLTIEQSQRRSTPHPRQIRQPAPAVNRSTARLGCRKTSAAAYCLCIL